MASGAQFLDRIRRHRTELALTLLVVSALWLLAGVLLRVGSAELSLLYDTFRAVALFHQLTGGALESSLAEATGALLGHLLVTGVLVAAALFQLGVVVCIARGLRDPDPLGLPLLVAALLAVLASLLAWTAAPLWASLSFALQGALGGIAVQTLHAAYVPLPEA